MGFLFYRFQFLIWFFYLNTHLVSIVFAPYSCFIHFFLRSQFDCSAENNSVEMICSFFFFCFQFTYHHKCNFYDFMCFSNLCVDFGQILHALNRLTSTLTSHVFYRRIYKSNKMTMNNNEYRFYHFFLRSNLSNESNVVHTTFMICKCNKHFYGFDVNSFM